jgi:hypothetical protein
MTVETETTNKLTRSDNDLGSSVRTILQGLILAGIIGVVTMMWRQNDVTAAQNVSLGELRVQVSMLQVSLAVIPDLSSRVTKLETRQADLLRRQGEDDVRWAQINNKNVKGWTR